LGFAAFDFGEVHRKWGTAEKGTALIAAVVAACHLAVSGIAAIAWRGEPATP
jgi:hypothetical protein